MTTDHKEPISSAAGNSHTGVAAHALPLSAPLNLVQGNTPADGGNLFIAPDEHDSLVTAYPAAEAFCKRFVGSAELLNGTYRWCLFLSAETKAQWEQIPPLMQHVAACKAYREQAPKTNAAYKLREQPWAFQEPITLAPALVIPRMLSEHRPYVPMAFVDDNTVVGDSAFLLPHASHYHFGILSSHMHQCWLHATASKLKSDYRYLRDLTYNTFIWPQATPEQQAAITTLAEEILLKRKFYLTQTLAELYAPETMPEDLKQAHAALDLAVEQLYRPETFADDAERTQFLVQLYASAKAK